MNSVAILLLVGTAAAAPIPKMIQEAATPGKLLGPPDTDSLVTHITSNFTVSLGDCTPDLPFQMDIYGLMGNGAIGVHGNVGITIDFVLGTDEPKAGDVYLRGDIEPNFFGLEAADMDEYLGYPFEYYNDEEPLFGRTIEITCAAATEIIVFCNDDYDVVVDATVTASEDGLGDDIELVSGEAAEDLGGVTRAKKGKGKSSVKDFKNDGTNPKKKIKVEHEAGNAENGIALVEAMVEAYPGGPRVKRTLIHESKEKPSDFKHPKGIDFECCDLDEDGDIEITFPGLSNMGKTYRVDARIGLSIDGAEPVGVVDVTSMIVAGGSDTLTVDGGWIRLALDDAQSNIKDDDFEVMMLDVVVSDPDNGYRRIGVKGAGHRNGIPAGNSNKRKMLNARPSNAEKKKDSQGMKYGKFKGKKTGNGKEKKGLRRDLQSNAKKILVHGYCAGNTASAPKPWPESDFSDAVTFHDPDAGPSDDGMNNWSHATFAQKIDKFADEQGITICSIIAHSQGGMASLHLYTYYWSCLDNAPAGRLIQTVGTPFQGTNLAGSLATLGDLFGAGCGSNSDLTTDGAAAWLAVIPSWARSAVFFYRTKYESKWWRPDHCHLATDILVSGDDDGTTGVNRGILEGGNNMGLTQNQCHTEGMRDPAQYKDANRNHEMNDAAAV